MPPLLTAAAVLIGFALAAYSIGVWAERYVGRLETWHLVFFWGGLLCDTLGTGLMAHFAGGLTVDAHGLTGIVAIVLMMLHTTWATLVIHAKDERAIVTFHRFSIVVWGIWLVPFFNGMFLNM